MTHVLIFALLAAGDPCAILPEASVRQIFEIAEGTPVRVVRSDSCNYLWMGVPPTGPQLREALMSGRGVPPRTSESISIRIEPTPDAIKELDARYEKLSKGYTVERDGQQLAVKPQKLTWVHDVGDKAFWNESLQQLVVARKGELVSFVLRKLLPQNELINLATTAAQAALRKQ